MCPVTGLALSGAFASGGALASLGTISTISAIGMDLSLIMGGMSMMSSMQQADAQADMYEMQAQQQEVAIELGKEESALRTKRLIAENRATRASSGISAESGSSLDVFADVARVEEYNQFSEQWNIKNDIASRRTQAGITRAEGKSEAITKGVGTLATVANGFA